MIVFGLYKTKGLFSWMDFVWKCERVLTAQSEAKEKEGYRREKRVGEQSLIKGEIHPQILFSVVKECAGAGSPYRKSLWVDVGLSLF